ncbi:RNA-binding protein Cwf29 [Sporothrix bragantina]|uniref:RNA-binding protein Cwf29 n=1 Tax=Sporothrix bragantina TaxID=671064 RepID=A0ABP0B7K1_9PEZI
MNKIRQIQELNKKELEQGISPNASWHTDYRDTAFIYFGGLPYDLSEGDVITIFSQYGEPVFLKLARDQETGKSKGFGWLKYEDQRSCDLAVDNLGGATIGGRLISVDHARYKARDDEDAEEFKVGWADIQRKTGIAAAAAGDNSDTDMGDATPSEDERDAKKKKTIRGSEHQPLLQEERELQKLIDEHDDEDPMKEFLVEEKKKEVDEARRRRDAKGDSDRHRSHRSSHRSHRSHRSSQRGEDEHKDSERREHRHRRREDDGERRRERSDRGRDQDRERDRDRDRDRRLGDREDGDSRRERDRDRDRYRDRDRDRDRPRDDRESPHRSRDKDRKDDRDDRHREKRP